MRLISPRFLQVISSMAQEPCDTNPLQDSAAVGEPSIKPLQKRNDVHDQPAKEIGGRLRWWALMGLLFERKCVKCK